MKLYIPTTSQIRQWRFFTMNGEKICLSIFSKWNIKCIKLRSSTKYMPYKLIVICTSRKWIYNGMADRIVMYWIVTKVISLKRLIRVIMNASWMKECIDQKKSTIWETTIEFSSLCGDFLWSRSLSKEST